MRIRKTVWLEVPDLGQQIKAARLEIKKQQGISLTKLAEQAGIARALWQRIERGKCHSHTYESILRIQRVLGGDWVEDDGQDLGAA